MPLKVGYVQGRAAAGLSPAEATWEVAVLEAAGWPRVPTRTWGKLEGKHSGLCRGLGLSETRGSGPLHPRVTAYLRATFISMTLKHHLLHA